MTKRIAIQLFGHMRTFEQCSAFLFKNVVEPNRAKGYQIDIYIHTWNELDHSTINYRNESGSDLADDAMTDSVINKIKSIYNPADISITPQMKIPEHIITEKVGNFKRSVRGCYNMAYSLYKGSEIRRKSRKKYDWVIVTRPDVLFMRPLVIDDILQVYKQFNFDIRPNTLFYANNPYRNNFGVQDPRILAGSDLIYFARPDVVDIATNLFCDFEKNIDFDDFYCMEVFWMSYFLKQKLNPLTINYNCGDNWIVLYKDNVPRLNKILRSADTVVYRLFNTIPLLKILNYENRRYYKLFGFITLICRKKY